MTCPGSHSKTVLPELNSPSTPCCMAGSHPDFLFSISFSLPGSSPLLGLLPLKFLLQKHLELRDVPYPIASLERNKEERETSEKRESHPGPYWHELVTAQSPGRLAVSACSLPAGRRRNSCVYTCQRNSLKSRDDAIFLPPAAAAGQVLEAHFGFIFSRSEVHVFGTAGHTEQSKAVRQGGL